MKVRLGIIGGGQLGLYLCEAAQRLGVQVAIISESGDDVALSRADKSIVGDLDNFEAVEQLLTHCDVITFDKEAVPSKTLAYLIEAQRQGRVSIHPGADTLLMLKDKALQKTWLEQQNLPTLPFHILSGDGSSSEFIVRSFGGALVQKMRCGGYDGRGVQILASAESGRDLWDAPSIVEPYLPDCREISVITVRAQSGEVQTYPPVGMDFDPRLNAVSRVSMPADISSILSARAIALAERIVTLLNGVGVFAVEMFITPDENLLVNEISPRVHNSGHITLDACNVSQFEQHVRAVTGLPLVKIEVRTPALMLNILYKDDLRGSCPQLPVANNGGDPGVTIYWYGKAPGRAGRKMGHINAVASSVAAAGELAAGAMAKLSSNTAGQAA